MDLDQDFGGEALQEFYKTVVDAYYGTLEATSAEAVDIKAIQDKYNNGVTTDPLPYLSDPKYYEEVYRKYEDKISEAMETNTTLGDTVSNARNKYTQAALEDFENKLNEAIKQGGVDLSDDVIPLDVEFDALPPFSDVQALQASNEITLENYNEDGSVKDKVKLTFTANTPGETANKFEIDLKYSSTSTTPTAKWKDSTLILTLPSNATLEDIQKAIDKASAEKSADGAYGITVSASTDTTESKHTVDVKDANGVVTGTKDVSDKDFIDGKYFDFSNALEGRTERLGLVGGRNNFFSDIATALSTVSLTDGRKAAEQTVADLETLRIQNDGTIIGRHAVHGLLFLGRIDIATFENPTGLEQAGTTLWRATLASGEAQVKIAGKDGAGEVVSGALEMSNVDLAQEFSDMIITQRGYQANSRIITVSDTMLEELINLKR
ncbi:MAG: flagellar hook-basal body complex protein [Ruminiclostridium sp.]|nr:flagellar hook-basal body complex protein [Ruminiclostridium sp.]